MYGRLVALGLATLLVSCKSSRVHSVSVGRGPVTVLVVHGGPGLRHDYLRPEWDRLASVARVTYYDQRGCGRSPRDGDLSVVQQLRDLDGLVQIARESGPVILAGSSWGAMLASAYTMRFPDRVSALILSGLAGWPRQSAEQMQGPSGPRPPSPRPPDPSSRAWNAPLPPEFFARLPLVADSLQSLKIHRHLRPGIAERLGETCIQAGIRIVEDASHAFPPFDSLRTLRLPILVLRGLLSDEIADAAPSYLSRLPTAVVLAVPTGGHDPWYDDPDLVFPAIARFLRTVSPVAPAESPG